MEVLSGRLLKKLTRVTLGKGLAEHIQYFEECPSGRELYAKAISYPKKIVEHRFIRLELERRRVEVMEYATKEHVHIFLDSLSDFDPDFSIDYRTKSQLRNIPTIHSFLTFP